MFIESFIRYLQSEKNYSPHTVLSYENDLLQFKEFVFGNGEFVPSEIDSTVVRHWLVSLMDEDYSARSVNRKLSALKSFFKYLVRNKILDSSPMRLVKGPKTDKPLPAFVRSDALNSIITESTDDNSFEAERNRAIIDMFFTTGIRCAELVGLKTGDVDFGANLIKVTGKRNKQRLIPFSTPLQEVMQSYLQRRADEIELTTDAFFVRKNGEAMSNSVVYNIVRRSLSSIPNLTKRSPHVLRHSFATAMLNSGADLNAVKELLGHQSLASTEVYTHTTFEELKRVYHQAHPRA